MAKQNNKKTTPPHSPEAEWSVLGSVILENHALNIVKDIIQPDDFYIPANREIFTAMLELLERGDPIDDIHILSQLNSKERLNVAGGEEYVLELSNQIPTAHNVESHAHLVRQKSLARHLSDICRRIEKGIYDEAYDDLRSYVEEAHKAIEKVSADTAAIDERARLTCVGDVASEPVEWLWPGRIPIGMPTMLDGDPGNAKSTLALELGGRVTRGHSMPDGSPGIGPAEVLILSAEDDIAHVIRPRLEAAGADLSFVHTLKMNDDSLPAIPGNVDELADAIKRTSARLVIVDPLVAYLDDEIDAHRDKAVRRALAPLARCAEQTGVALLLIRHLAKSGGRAALYRGGGSIGMSAAARSVLLVGPDPRDDDTNVLATVKCNLAPKRRSLSYTIQTISIQTAAGPAEVSCIGWGSERDITADELVAAMDNRGCQTREPKHEADVVGAIVSLMEEWPHWEGPPATLLHTLQEYAADDGAQWPADAAALSKRLNSAKDKLWQHGIQLSNHRFKKERKIILRTVGGDDALGDASPSSADPSSRHHEGEAMTRDASTGSPQRVTDRVTDESEEDAEDADEVEVRL